jgi:putative ABC transport system permease protein
MSAENFADFFPHRAPGRDPLSVIDLGVIKLAQGSDTVRVQQSLREILPDDTEVVTRGELIQREMAFWRTNAPVGYIFLVGVYVGFIVGVVICYQIIYTDIAGHMREFATLKAMGYTNEYFLSLVMYQAGYLSVMGFVPGALVSYACYRFLSGFTGLTMQMTLYLAVIVFLVTLAMCVVSGLLALRKLLTMDPAELF